MAVNMTLKCGKIKGESAIDGHKEEIDVLSFAFGGTQSGTMHTGTGGGAGKANVHDLTVTKWVDIASPELMLACFNGTHIKEAILSVRKAGGEKAVDYLKITMTDCLISSVNTGGSGGEDRFTENVSINFAKVKVDYDTQTAAGGKGSHGSMEFAIAENK
jgi:type VI secretion system secreted protein Hcp